jgi:Ion channel
MADPGGGDAVPGEQMSPSRLVHMHPQELRESYRYGAVLALAVISLAFQLGASDHGVTRLLSGLLQAATLALAFWASPPSNRVARRAGAGLLIVGVLVLILAALLGSDSVGRAVGSSVACLLTVAAAAAIARGVIHGIRQWRQVTLQAAFGALTIYLLIGISIGFAYDTIAAISTSSIFVGGQAGSHQNDVYFSFITLTTVGYGDLAPINRAARALAVLEALFGQLYLVTIVALIVTNVGRRRPES